jgi:hypothetical protein
MPTYLLSEPDTKHQHQNVNVNVNVNVPAESQHMPSLFAITNETHARDLVTLSNASASHASHASPDI